MSITFRDDTSFPFLKIAREHGMPYGDVIRFAATIKGVRFDDWERPEWQCAAQVAWLNENDRRRDVARGLVSA